MNTPLSSLGENKILKRILQDIPSNEDVLIGPGDDCALVKGDDTWDILLKTDVVVEGIHFLRETSPALKGRKALARAISDIAAMGGIPTHALITILMHPSRSIEELESIYRDGLNPLAAQYGISIAGGESSSLPYDGLIINVALTGKIEHGCAITRSAGQPGDIIVVSGKLGGSFESGRHLTFEPRLSLARYLIEHGLAPHAMMDLSDGLATDLPRLAEASACGYQLDESLLPCHEGIDARHALCDGEDYELLLCFSPEIWKRLKQHAHPISLTAIGELNSQPGSENSQSGWQHFQA